MPPTSTHNLNSKPPPPAPRSGANKGTGVSWSASAIQSSAPPVRIVGAGSRYRGGYRVNV